MAEKTLNLLENIQKGISPSYLGSFNRLVNVDLDNVKGGVTSNYRLRSQFPYSLTTGMGGKEFTANVNDTCTATGTGAGIWAVGQAVTLTTTGTLPAGLAASTIYYAIALGAGTFKLADTLAKLKSATAVNITDTGSGTHTVTAVYVNESSDFRNIVNYGSTMFGVDGGGQIWMYDAGYSEIWVKIKGDTSNFVNIVVWKNYLLGFDNTNGIKAFGPLTDLDTAAWQTWDTATPTLVHGGLYAPTCTMTNGILYVGDNNDVFSIEETAGDVFDPTDDASYAFNQSALDLPTGTYISGLAELGGMLRIGTFEDKSRIGKIYSWDTTAPSFEQPLICNGDSVRSMKVLNNILYFFTADRVTGYSNGKLYATNGTSIQEVASLQNDGEVQQFGDEFKIYRYAVTTGKDKLYFSVGGSYRNGVYTYNPQTGAIVQEFTAASLSETTVSIGGLLYYDDDLITGLLDTTYETGYTGQMQRLEVSSTYRKATAAYGETGVMTVGTKYQPRTFRFFEIQLGKELVSGEVVTLYYRNNLTDAYITIGTMSYATQGAVHSHIIENSAVQGDQIQFKFMITAGASATVAPELRAIFVY